MRYFEIKLQVLANGKLIDTSTHYAAGEGNTPSTNGIKSLIKESYSKDHKGSLIDAIVEPGGIIEITKTEYDKHHKFNKL